MEATLRLEKACAINKLLIELNWTFILFFMSRNWNCLFLRPRSRPVWIFRLVRLPFLLMVKMNLKSNALRLIAIVVVNFNILLSGFLIPRLITLGNLLLICPTNAPLLVRDYWERHKRRSETVGKWYGSYLLPSSACLSVSVLSVCLRLPFCFPSSSLFFRFPSVILAHSVRLAPLCPVSGLSLAFLSAFCLF